MTNPAPRDRHLPSLPSPRPILIAARRIGAVAVLAIALLFVSSQVASAHVVPWTTIQLDVQDGRIEATVNIPMDDLEATEFLVDKVKQTKNNAEFFDSMRRG